MRPSDSLIVSSTEPVGANRKKVWIQKGKNLLDGIKVGGIGSTGLLESNSTRLTSENAIKVNSSTIYTISIKTYNTSKGDPKVNVIFYDKDNNFISFSGWKDNNYTFTTPNNCNYVRLLFYFSNSTSQTLVVSDITESQLEQGAKVTEYEEYVEEKIYVKNSNDVYEEFISKESDLEKTNYFKEYYSNSSLSAQANDTVDVYTAEDIYLTGKDLLITTSIAVYVTANMWVLFVCIDGKDYELSNGDNTSMQFKTTQVILRELEKGTHKISFKLKSLGNGIAYLSGHNRMSFTAIEL